MTLLYRDFPIVSTDLYVPSGHKRDISERRSCHSRLVLSYMHGHISKLQPSLPAPALSPSEIRDDVFRLRLEDIIQSHVSQIYALPCPPAPSSAKYMIPSSDMVSLYDFSADPLAPDLPSPSQFPFSGQTTSVRFRTDIY